MTINIEEYSESIFSWVTKIPANTLRVLIRDQDVFVVVTNRMDIPRMRLLTHRVAIESVYYFINSICREED